MGKPEGNKSLGRPRLRQFNNIKTYLKETECEVVDWIDMVVDRVKWWDFVNTGMNLRVDRVSGNF